MPQARLFDFREPLPMPAAAAGLVAAIEDAAPRVGLLLGLGFGRPVPVRASSVRRVALVEVATPGGVWATIACGLPDAGLLLVPRETAIAVADLALGGLGVGEARPATPLEQQLLGQHVGPALRPLADALAERGVTGLVPAATTDRPLPAGMGEVLAVALELELPSGTTAALTVCLPAKSLLPADVEPPAPAPTTATQRVLGDVPVEVAVRLAPAVVSADEVEDLHPGDVIRIDPESLTSLIGVLAGEDCEVPVITGSLGRRGKLRAVSVNPSTAHGGL